MQSIVKIRSVKRLLHRSLKRLHFYEIMDWTFYISSLLGVPAEESWPCVSSICTFIQHFDPSMMPKAMARRERKVSKVEKLQTITTTHKRFSPKAPTDRLFPKAVFSVQNGVATQFCCGRFSEFGGPIHKRPVQDLAFAVARFIQKGGSFVNYYMVGVQTSQMEMLPTNTHMFSWYITR
ncbi:uncharacterized protein LOC131620157 [Vicia villosa]|uniref:uncharacterized protein LOC131620157 n=1 Tax=Vicia villosa TaxID=3911 RepID=UPI00273A9340|nr:uncharacterized protein LOC131620157 [Vicia villosa]